MTMKRLFFVAMILPAFFSQPVKAQQYAFDKKIPVPGDAGYDYMAIDEANNHLFVSHGTAFNVIDLATEQPIAVIDGLKGVHGIAIVNEVNKGFISDVLVYRKEDRRRGIASALYDLIEADLGRPLIPSRIRSTKASLVSWASRFGVREGQRKL